ELLNFDLSSVNLRKIPRTAALLEQKFASATPEQAWWLDTLKRGELPWGTDEPGTCLKKRLFRRYLEHARERGVSRRSTETMLGIFWAKHVPGLDGRVLVNYVASYSLSGKETKRRGRGYKFPPLDKCRKAFASMVQQEIDWGGGNDAWHYEDESVD